MSRFREFVNRTEAGLALAEALATERYERPVVLALPRGGVPLGAEVAKALHAPLDLVLVRKIGMPDQPELALAAVVDGEHPELVINENIRRFSSITDDDLRDAQAVALTEIERRRSLYLAGRARPNIEGATVIVVDDGIATGATMRAALKGLRRKKPARLVLAVAVAPADVLNELQSEVDQIVCLSTPSQFRAIGLYYQDFSQVSDEQVIALLEQADRENQTRRPC